MEVLKEGDIEGNGGIEQHIVDVVLATFFLVPLDELPNFRLVGLHDVPRLGHDFFIGLHVAKNGIRTECKRPFQWVEDVHHDDFVFAMAKMLDSVSASTGARIITAGEGINN